MSHHLRLVPVARVAIELQDLNVEEDMAMVCIEDAPLLASNSEYSRGYTNVASTPANLEGRNIDPSHDRSLENDVLPETAVLGRNIGWSSAYIITISRVIGSGIFATPGAILKSVGSVGLSLVLWVVGAGVAWCGLAVALEYGCMLPRSGGKTHACESFSMPS